MTANPRTRRETTADPWVTLGTLTVVDLDGKRELRGRLGLGQVRVVRAGEGTYSLQIAAVPKGHAVREHPSFEMDESENPL